MKTSRVSLHLTAAARQVLEAEQTRRGCSLSAAANQILSDDMKPKNQPGFGAGHRAEAGTKGVTRSIVWAPDVLAAIDAIADADHISRSTAVDQLCREAIAARQAEK